MTAIKTEARLAPARPRRLDDEADRRLAPTPLLPGGYEVPASRWTHPATRMRELLRTEPYLFGPGVYDPMGAQLVMYHGFKAVYFSGYSFAIGHLGTTDMDLYSGPRSPTAPGARCSALRKFQLTMAVGDPEKGIAPRHLEIPPVIVDMDARLREHLQRPAHDRAATSTPASPRRTSRTRCCPSAAATSAARRSSRRSEMVGKLRMVRAVADDLGNADFVIIARTDGLSAVDAPESARGLELAVERALRYLDTGVPDLRLVRVPDLGSRARSRRSPTQVRRRFPEARFAFNWSWSFKWFNDPDPITFAAARRAGLQVHLHHPRRPARDGPRPVARCSRRWRERQEQGYIELQRRECGPGADFPTRSHH